jgi:glycosyltransferase involved in cell wall biosynthesis
MKKRFLIDQKGKLIPIRAEEPKPRKKPYKGDGVGTGFRFVNLSRTERHKLSLSQKTREINPSIEEIMPITPITGKVLVIIPAYNAEKTIRESINSVLQQSYKDILVVVVNDASTDETLNIIKSIDDHRLKWIDKPINGGTYEAINSALYQYEESFDFFTIHGSDDMMLEDKIEIQLRSFEDPNILASSAGYRRINFENGQTITEFTYGESMVIYDKKVFEELGYYDNTRFGGDTEYIDRFLLTFGEKSIKRNSIILSNCYVSDWNLTKKIRKEERRKYSEAYKTNHRSLKDLYVGYFFKDIIKVIMLSVGDFAGSGNKIKEAILSQDKNIEMYSVVIKSHKYGYPSDFILSEKNREEIQKLIDDCDIIHFKGDDLPKRNWYGLTIPENKKIVLTVGGSGFRRGDDPRLCLEWHPIKDYLEITDFRSTITPDLNYPEFKGVYIPHAIDVDSAPYTFKIKDKLTIQHSPSMREKKGSDNIILPALYELKNEGFDFDIDLIENVSNYECIERKKKGNIFIDQICETGFYGMSAIESMQFGIPTIAYISDKSKIQSNGIISESSKILNVKDKEELKDSLRYLLNNPQILETLSIETKDYASKIHSYYHVGNLWINFYKKILEKQKRILLSQYRPAIRLYKWAKSLKKLGYSVEIVSTGEPIHNIDFSEFKIHKYDKNLDYSKLYDLHISFNTNIKSLSHINIKTIQAVGDLKSYYEENKNDEKKSFEDANKIVFVSENQMNEALKFYPEIKEKSYVLVNGIISELRQKKSKNKLNNGFINLVYSGTISDNVENHRYFYKFFKKISESKEIKLHLYPSAVGLPKIYEELENVILHKTIDPIDLIEELTQYDCALLYLEGNKMIADSMLPNKIFEYLQAGLPIVSGDYAEIRKLNNNENYIQFFSDENDIVEKIKKSLKIREDLQKSKVVSYEDQSKKILEIIES